MIGHFFEALVALLLVEGIHGLANTSAAKKQDHWDRKYRGGRR